MHNRHALEPQRDQMSVAIAKAIDTEHLRLLAIFHYVLGGFTIATSSLFLIHFFMGMTMVLAGFGDAETGTRTVGVIFATIAATAILGGWTIGGLNIYAGRCLRKCKNRTFALVMSGLNCLQIPWGLILGILTIRVLLRDNVRESFEASKELPVSKATAPPAISNQTALVAEAFAEEEAMWRRLEENHRAGNTGNQVAESAEIEKPDSPQPESQPEEPRQHES